METCFCAWGRGALPLVRYFGTVLPDKFVTGCITAKRQEFGIADLIGSLDVEEKARVKDVRGKKIVEGNSSAHMVQKNLQNSHKKKFKQELKQKNTIPFNNKKENKEKENVASPGIMLRSARRASGSPKKYANMVEADGGTSRRCSSLLMGNGARATVRGVGTVDLNLISGKTMQVKNV